MRRDPRLARQVRRKAIHQPLMDHQGKSLNQPGHDLERGASAAEDQPRSKRGDWNSMTGEDALYLDPALQVLRKGFVGRTQSTKEDDLFDAGVRCSTREVVGADQVQVRELALCQLRRGHHVVNEIDGVFTTLEGALSLLQREEITLAIFGKAIATITLGA
ncbi:MAG: hypothetical protein OER77_01375 [Myxococcales bacterium]|nr:hypothetical protein [Myxococcales bacterium]